MIRNLLRRVTHNWVQKLVALCLAIVGWYVISISDTSVSQRSLRVPVTIEGLSASQTQSGAPTTVDVIVSGRSSSVNALRPENFRATLDLSNATGEYQERIIVVPPQDISLISVSPETAIGSVETISSKEVPVLVALENQTDRNSVFTASTSVQTVRATGRESVLAQVASATAFVNAAAGESSVTLFASDANGQPVAEITLEPSSATVTLTATPVLHSKTVALEVTEPETEPNLRVENLSLSQTTLLVASTREQLSALENITGIVEIPEDSEAGEYTLSVTPQLPEGVWALERVTAQFTLTAVNPLSTSQQESNNN
jgi:YbbR domain-containing protein